MAMKRWKKYCAAGLLATFLYLSSPTSGCGPFFPQTYFITSRLPDYPLQPYAAGKVGIVLPTYARSYLVVAYRYFSGKPLNADEQTAALKLWNDRLSATREMASQPPQVSRVWLNERAKIAKISAPAEIREFADKYEPIDNVPGYYVQYRNCLADGFATAAATLRDRAAKWGAEAPELADWVRGQDTVFSNCGGFPSGPEQAKAAIHIPDPAPASAPVLLRADRAYQIAAAEFYGARFEDAEAAFRTISEDRESAWRAIAALMVARCEIRLATLATGGADQAAAHLRAADAQLRKIKSDPSLREVHAGAGRLLDFVEFRIHPDEQLHELAARITDSRDPAGFGQNLSDYSALLDEVRGEIPDGAEARLTKDAVAASSAGRLPRRDDITDWILNYEDGSPAAAHHASEQWQKTQSVPWLVSSLAKASPQDPGARELMAAAQKLPADSPAYLAATFGRLRLQAATAPDAAAKELDGVLDNAKIELPKSSRNLFLALRMKTSASLDDFLRYAPRVPSAVSNGFDELEIPSTEDEGIGNVETNKKLNAPNPYFDWDAAQVLDRALPLSMLADAAASTNLPPALRIEVARAGWTRAVLLRDDSAKTFAATLAEIDADLRPAMQDFQKTAAADEQHHAAIWILLRNPGLRPYVTPGLLREGVARTDSYRDNWWCGLSVTAGQPGGPTEIDRVNPRPQDPLITIYPDRAAGTPRFLPAAEKAKAGNELATLRAIDTAPNYLVKETLAWAKSQHDDPRLSEALYWAVRATRFGCTDADSSNLSRKAFVFLHENYPDDPFTAKTKYWY
jgi:hypothetical protein